VTINPNLDASGVESLCCTYKQRFATSHAIDCSYRSDAEWYLKTSTVPEKSPLLGDRFLVPLCFASVLPLHIVNLLEDLNPRQILHRKLTDFLDLTPEPVSSWEFRQLSLSKDIQNFDPTSIVEPQDDTSLADRVSNALRDANDNNSNNFTIAAMLALFGWSVKSVTKSDSICTFTLKCPICLATPSVVADKKKPTEVDNQILTTPQKKKDGPNKQRTPRIVIESSDSSSEEEEEDTIRTPPRKRLRIVQDTIDRKQQGMDPLSSHRHYCIMARGFQFDPVKSATPCWKIIASNLLQDQINQSKGKDNEESAALDNHHRTGEDVLDAVRKTLRAGIGNIQK